MKPAPFAYDRPADLAAATALLVDGDGAAMAICGGQSLVVLMSLRLTAIETLVDLSRLPELKRVEETATEVFLGAATTHAMVEDARVPDPSRGLMARVAGKIAYRAVRNLGTLGGSVALADPSADWPACLMALNAQAVIVGPDGERREAVETFVRGPYETSLAGGEVIVGFAIPRLGAGSRWGVAKVARKSGAFADSLAIVVAPGAGAPHRVALAGTSSHAQLLPQVASYLGGAPCIDPTALRAAVRADLAQVDPDADPYRLRCHGATVLKAVMEARAT